MINSSDIYYQNSIPEKNIAKKSGKEFCIFFQKDKVYMLFKDGSSELIKKNAPNDQALMELGIKSGQIKRVNLQEWLDNKSFYSRN